MWSDILTGYGIFILEILTILLVIAAIVAMIISAKQRNAAHHGELVVTDLLRNLRKQLSIYAISNFQKKSLNKRKNREESQKQEAKALKAKIKNGEKAVPKPCVYVLDFKGDISASETTALREEISAIINVAKANDEVLLRLESPGGVVHGFMA